MKWLAGEVGQGKKSLYLGIGVAIAVLISLVCSFYWVAGGWITPAGFSRVTPPAPLLAGAVLLYGLIFLTLLACLWISTARRRQAEEKLAESQERLRSLTSQLSLAEERERRRIAVYLHDNIGQKLAIASIKLGQLKDAALAAESDPLVVGLNEIRLLFKQIIQDTKSLTFKISSPILYELGLEAALEWLSEELQNQHGILAYFEDDNQPKPLDEDLRVLIFQAVNELLLNVVKHARARQVQVAIGRDNGQIHVTIHDDGVGFNVNEISSRWGRKDGGFGLFSIRERLKAFGGLLEVKSDVYGTAITLRAPLQDR